MKKRVKDILNQLHTEGRVKAHNLAELYEVSMETIRRDLELLEKQGHATRVYGGAVLKEMAQLEPYYGKRKTSNFIQKQKIAKKATDYLKDGETIFIDIGTTLLEFAKTIDEVKQLTVITNSIPIALELVEKPNIQVILLGGQLRTGDSSTSGFVTEDTMKLFYVDKLFLGVGAISVEHGIEDFHIIESNLRRVAIERAKQVIALTDYSKFGTRAMNHICNISSLDMLITDEGADTTIIRRIKELGVKIVIA